MEACNEMVGEVICRIFQAPHPTHGAKLRWQDKVHQDLKKFGISESWYVEAHVGSYHMENGLY